MTPHHGGDWEMCIFSSDVCLLVQVSSASCLRWILGEKRFFFSCGFPLCFKSIVLVV